VQDGAEDKLAAVRDGRFDLCSGGVDEGVAAADAGPVDWALEIEAAEESKGEAADQPLDWSAVDDEWQAPDDEEAAAAAVVEAPVLGALRRSSRQAALTERKLCSMEQEELGLEEMSDE
jgi:hypothetical protein